MVHGSTRQLRRLDKRTKKLPIAPPGFESGLNSQQLRFVYFYTLLGNGTHAALYAGYSPHAVGANACRLLRNPVIQQAIEHQHVDREADAKVTYANLVRLTQVAMEHVDAIKVNGMPEDVSRAIEVAGRAVERIARCQGLLTGERPDAQKVDLIKATLQDMVRRARESKLLEAPKPQAATG
jgi:phage terminase small subunit